MPVREVVLEVVVTMEEQGSRTRTEEPNSNMAQAATCGHEVEQDGMEEERSGNSRRRRANRRGRGGGRNRRWEDGHGGRWWGGSEWREKVRKGLRGRLTGRRSRLINGNRLLKD